MKYLKPFAFFTAGGTTYVLLELLWRKRSHISMFLTGGACFLLLGKLRDRQFLTRALMGSAIITTAELIAGLLFNRNYNVWDYRNEPLNFKGQICPLFSFLWMPVSLGGIWLYQQADNLWNKNKRR